MTETMRCPNCERIEQERSVAVCKNISLMERVKELEAERDALRALYHELAQATCILLDAFDYRGPVRVRHEFEMELDTVKSALKDGNAAGCGREVDALRTEHDALRVRYAELRAAVAEVVEDGPPANPIYNRCRYCGELLHFSHAPDCPWSRLVALVEGASDAPR